MRYHEQTFFILGIEQHQMFELFGIFIELILEKCTIQDNLYSVAFTSSWHIGIITRSIIANKLAFS